MKDGQGGIEECTETGAKVEGGDKETGGKFPDGRIIISKHK